MKNIPEGDGRQCRIIKRMALSYFEERIQLSLKSASAAQLQMRIASFPDRNLAIALDMIVPADQDRLLAVLPALIEIINKTAPTINIKTSHLRKEDRKIALEEGKLDMVIGVKQEFGSNIRQQYLFSDREVCIMRKDHPDITSTLNMEQYVAAEFISLSVSEYEEQAIDVKLKELGIKRKIRLIVENEATIPHLIVKTDFLANVVDLVANAFAPWLPIKIMDMPIPITDIKFYQYWHTRHQEEPAHVWLRQTIKNVCETINSDING